MDGYVTNQQELSKQSDNIRVIGENAGKQADGAAQLGQPQLGGLDKARALSAKLHGLAQQNLAGFAKTSAQELGAFHTALDDTVTTYQNNETDAEWTFGNIDNGKK